MADDLRRLVAATRQLTLHVDMRTSAEQLYLDAAAVAESRLPGPVGISVAAVLAMAAHERGLVGIRGALGADRTMLSLALAVLETDRIPDMPDVADESPS